MASAPRARLKDTMGDFLAALHGVQEIIAYQPPGDLEQRLHETGVGVFAVFLHACYSYRVAPVLWCGWRYASLRLVPKCWSVLCVESEPPDPRV